MFRDVYVLSMFLRHNLDKIVGGAYNCFMDLEKSRRISVYPIGTVSRLVGISVATLRAWERRYGFPCVARTPGGHRLYTEGDIALLRWVKAQIDRGMSVRHAIQAARDQGIQDRLFALETFPPKKEILRQRLLDALLHHDLSRADRIIGEMLATFSVEEITLDIIGPVLRSLGDGWERGDVSIATEHVVSNYLRHRLLVWMTAGLPHREGPPVALACAPGEWHEGSLLMTGLILARRGIPVMYLGQNVPLDALADVVERTPVSLVVLVAMMEETARSLADWPGWIRQRKGRPAVGFGGRAFVEKPELRAIIPGYFLGETIPEGVNRIVALLEGA